MRIAGLEFPAQYGHKRQDVQDLLGALIYDPQYPAVGFRGKIDTRRLDNGEYAMEFVGITRWGREEVFYRRPLTVRN